MQKFNTFIAAMWYGNCTHILESLYLRAMQRQLEEQAQIKLANKLIYVDCCC